MLSVNNDILEGLDDYHEKSLLVQRVRYDKTLKISEDELRQRVDDDLVYYVPIYDMLDRRYAAFSSFPEALKKKHLDPKGNGQRFEHDVEDDDFIKLLYLFRLCGSGINYKPGEHGFGNFWIVTSILRGRTKYSEWLQDLPDSRFCDNKGYLLPQFKTGLRHFIQTHSLELTEYTMSVIDLIGGASIKEVVDIGNSWLVSKGFNKQYFVLSAFAADLAEYFPKLVDPDSMIYAGTNAKKCIQAVFGSGTKEEEAIRFLSARYKAPPYSVEDSRLCDPVRYFLDYQSKHHVEHNQGMTFYNNSILKKKWNTSQYTSFQSRLRA
jgi:hypothetical protein